MTAEGMGITDCDDFGCSQNADVNVCNAATCRNCEGRFRYATLTCAPCPNN